MALHERTEAADHTPMGSSRAFGFVFTVIFALVAGYQLWHGHDWGWVALAVAACFLAAALMRPALLQPLNLVWFKFGLLLHRVVNPLVMGLLFFGSVFPISLLMRVFGKRPLNLKFDRAAPTYWIGREATDLDADSFKRQF